MVCIDNSDYTRNGDYAPTRFESQTDAVNLVCGAKTQQNPENSVGMLCTAGDCIQVMITPTTDLGKIVSEIPKASIGGTSDMLRGIQTAQLALKHRQNKHQKQRIIAFVGSPIGATEKELETLGKNLKKNNVSLDLVSFGEVEENKAKLEKLLNAVNSNDTSRIIEIPQGAKLLSDVLLSSPIINDGEGGGMGAVGGGGGDNFEFGINPNDDPELALALRISMEEERARQQQADGGAGAAAAPAMNGEGGATGQAPATNGASAPPAAAGGTAPTVGASAAPHAAVMESMDMEDMDEELRQALLLSMQDADPAPAPAAGGDAAGAAAGASKPAEPGKGGEVDSKWFQDPNFVQELLGSLPGVDINDPRIQNALKEVQGEDKKKDEEGEDKDKKDKKDGGSGSGGSGGSGSK